MRLLWTALALMIVLTALNAAPASAQAATRAPAADSDPIAVLTAELRALRAELADTMRAGLRLQMLVARVQAQEQRIIYLDRQRSETATRLAQAEQMRAMFGMNMTPRPRPGVPPEEREAMERQAEQIKAQLTAMDANIQRLQAEEAQAASALGAEQGRWNDFNTRLDELERSLSQK